MNQISEFSAYPLTEELTRRVVSYLCYFRLFISAALAFAYWSGALVLSDTLNNPALAVTALTAYFILAAYMLVEARGHGTAIYPLAKTSLFVDMLFLSLMLLAFGGLESGLGILLVFATATAAITLPLRLALFLASLATLVIIGEAALSHLLRDDALENMVRSGIYGLIIFITALLAHKVAYWVRDFRLIAERQQRTLTRLEQINELIIRRMRSGVLAVDRAGEIRMMNESAWFLLGSPPALERYLPDVSPELHESMTAWRRDPTAETPPVTLQASQAEVVPKFVALPGEHEIRTLVFLEDNDVVAQRAIEMSASSLAKLSGSIAHEIRNPLAAVSHAAQLLAEADGIPEPEERLVRIIEKQARRMNGIVENILQLSRREKSRPELFELTGWLQSLRDEFAGTVPMLDFQSRIDTRDGEVMVMFDRNQLHQALWKLMENAAEHAGRENVVPRVTLRLAHGERTGHCVISVEDNGPGIPDDRLGQIFEPFYTTRQEGTGLGLYVARQICEANQAELTVDSLPEHGTRFHLRLATAKGGDSGGAVHTGAE